MTTTALVPEQSGDLSTADIMADFAKFLPRMMEKPAAQAAFPGSIGSCGWIHLHGSVSLIVG
jgi:hypothetical protein